MMKPVLVLAGGFGTRLKSVVPDLPKPLADVNGKPFLWWLLRHLENQGATDVYLSVGYLHEKIQDYFGQKYNHINLHYVIETEPLGTGGAITNAAQYITEEKFLVLNGDTLAMLELKKFIDNAEEHDSKLSIAVVKVEDATRYGTVMIDDNHRITGFAEKGQSGLGKINAGNYLIDKAIFNEYEIPRKFSFETDFLAKYIKTLNLLAYDELTDFIDIGIPEDYAEAQYKVPEMVNKL